MSVYNILSLDSVYKSFGGIKAVFDATFDLKQGVITALVGPNGAGKTTIFNIINGQLRPDRGKILYLGEDITHSRSTTLARSGVVRSFQDLKLFEEMTVRENLLVGMERSSFPWQRGGRSGKIMREREVRQIAERLELGELINEVAANLSYAERKFLSLGRLMGVSSKLWLLDEPASGLDPTSMDRFEALLRQVQKEGVSICIIEHTLDLVERLAQQIIFLHQGTVLASGAAEDILNDQELIEIYFAEQ